MFLSEADWQAALSGRQVIALDPFEHPEAPGVVSFGGRQGRTFAAERQTEGVTVFDAVVAHAKRLRGESKRVIVACWSNGARERLATLLPSTALARPSGWRASPTSCASRAT